LKLYLSPKEKKTLVGRITTGDLLEAEVIECLDYHKTVISVGGLTIIAVSNLDLRTGDRIVVEVTQLEPKIIFNLIFRKNKRSKTLKVKV